MVLNEEEIRIIKHHSDSSLVHHLCESHEELRKEKDRLAERCRMLILEKSTVREKRLD